jgi:GAF domain-containing protein
MADTDLAAYRAAHPLATVIGVLRELVGAPAEDGGHLMAVSDAAGRLLWVEGHRGERKRAEAMNFIEGAAWDEGHAGTNAPGTALALDHAVQIFSAEHFRHPVQDWTCAAAPIHDPATGKVLGVIDVTGGDVVAHPHSLALVQAAARVAEAELGWERARKTGLWLPDGLVPDRLELLGRDEGLLRLGGRPVRLNRRHSEVVFLLLTHPMGMSGDQLADALYGDVADPATVRVEMTRLRRVIGDLLESRPYRLAQPVPADYLEVAAALHRGDTGAALNGYAGPLLPRSEAPGVVTRRRWLEVQLRSAVLAVGDPQLLLSWAERFGFDDLALWERLVTVLPDWSASCALAAARVAELRADYGLEAMSR